MHTKKIPVLLFGLLMMTTGISAQETDDFSGLKKMRSSFEQSFEEKAVTVDVNQVPTTPSYQPEPNQDNQEEYWEPADVGQIKKSEGFNVSYGNDGQHWTYSLIALLLAIWVAWDASNIGARAGLAPGFPDFGPVGWFFLTLCCWCIGFPFYVSKRARYIEANKKISSGIDVQRSYAAHEAAVDPTGGMIPYKNTPALIGYYLGIFSLIPCLGLLLGLPALILGIMGLIKQNENPKIKGGAHALTGVILGGLALAVNLFILSYFIGVFPWY